MYKNTLIELNPTPQELYDAYNKFIFAKDGKVFERLIARSLFFSKVVSVPGDVVELGVFKGAGMAAFIKLKHMFLSKSSPMKVVGFDCFDSEKLLSVMTDEEDRKKMEELFVSRKFKPSKDTWWNTYTSLKAMGASDTDFELVDGDICDTIVKFVKESPGFRARLVYIDVDVYKPTLVALEALWDRIPRGGIIVFDDYGIDQWSEANAVDEFFADKPDVQLVATNLVCPTAYYIKT